MVPLAAMFQPATYPHPVERIRHLETHISHVFLTGEFAYKLKKPIQNPFLDYRTLEAREQYCRAELALNRRFSPELYLDVVALARDQHGWNLAGRGEICDYAVKMRQFEQAALLLSQLQSGQLNPTQMRSLGAELAEIHRAAPVLTDPHRNFGTFPRVAAESRDNLASLRQTLPAKMMPLVAGLERQIELQLSGLGPAIAERRACGCVRECHGDLHLGNLIWQAGRVMLFDGIEFNDSFRWIDVMSDFGFVLMDLEEHRQGGLANLLLNVYLEHSGDYAGLRVLTFYKVYRAMVRAKVAGLRAGQQSGSEQTASFQEVENYLAYARVALEPRRPQLILTHGFSGSGKTHQTESLLDCPGVVRIRSDVERKRWAGLESGARAVSEPGTGLYTAAHSLALYRQLAELAEVGLKAGWTIVLDATFLNAEHRLVFHELAGRLGVPLRILHFQAPVEVLRARLQARQDLAEDASDAGWPVLQAQLRDYVPLSNDELAVCISIERLRAELDLA